MRRLGICVEETRSLLCAGRAHHYQYPAYSGQSQAQLSVWLSHLRQEVALPSHPVCLCPVGPVSTAD